MQWAGTGFAFSPAVAVSRDPFVWRSLAAALAGLGGGPRLGVWQPVRPGVTPRVPLRSLGSPFGHQTFI